MGFRDVNQDRTQVQGTSQLSDPGSVTIDSVDTFDGIASPLNLVAALLNQLRSRFERLQGNTKDRRRFPGQYLLTTDNDRGSQAFSVRIDVALGYGERMDARKTRQ